MFCSKNDCVPPQSTTLNDFMNLSHVEPETTKCESLGLEVTNDVKLDDF